MESNESKSQAQSPAQAEPTSANRRAFMKTVVTGTVAAGLVASVGKAEAATTDICGAAVELPPTHTRVKVIFNKNVPPTLADIHRAIDDIIGQSSCTVCGLVGFPDLPIIRELSFETAYLPQDRGSIVTVQDFSS